MATSCLVVTYLLRSLTLGYGSNPIGALFGLKIAGTEAEAPPEAFLKSERCNLGTMAAAGSTMGQ